MCLWLYNLFLSVRHLTYLITHKINAVGVFTKKKNGKSESKFDETMNTSFNLKIRIKTISLKQTSPFAVRSLYSRRAYSREYTERTANGDVCPYVFNPDK